MSNGISSSAVMRPKRVEVFESQAKGFEVYVVDLGKQMTWGFSALCSFPDLLLGDAMRQLRGF